MWKTFLENSNEFIVIWGNITIGLKDVIIRNNFDENNTLQTISVYCKNDICCPVFKNIKDKQNLRKFNRY